MDSSVGEAVRAFVEPESRVLGAAKLDPRDAVRMEGLFTFFADECLCVEASPPAPDTFDPFHVVF